ncbi:hypothetical protein SEA_ABBA_55 [Arthrobacter phage Abba]|uniref:Uncharacterized protein n=1 Tax=Arthrobacter phage Abba TaxID=2713256 RepID=A0A6G8R2G5_9CAUD|nr:hypothetical protein HYQ28_gp55 [Arthrobacter phage Abba]QIN94384.1 hypothetical protein SEA_ABBA_55 [Arthrobacter phage Abba]
MKKLTVVFNQMNNVAAIPNLWVRDSGRGSVGVKIAQHAHPLMKGKAFFVDWASDSEGALVDAKQKALVPFEIVSGYHS